MEPVEKIVKALAAGAASNFRPNVQGLVNSEVIDHYQALKDLIGRKYGKIDEDLLEIGPASAGRQQQMMTQLQAAGADEDEEILLQVEILLAVIREHDPEAFWAATPTQHDEPANAEIEAAVDSAVEASKEASIDVSEEAATDTSVEEE
jgi:hypothetical protein